MIHALLKGKVATGEDAVTSAVFGALRYMPHEIGLEPWLSLARRLDGTRLADRGPWRASFWPALRYDEDTVEPDVLLVPASHDAPTLLVECKLWSGPSGWPSLGTEGPLQGQLGRQWAALRRHLDDEKAREQRATPRSGRLLYVTADPVMPRETLQDMIAEVDAKVPGSKLTDHLYWVSWRSLVGALGQPRTEIESIAHDDLRRLMEKYGFVSCGEVKPPKPSKIDWKFAP